MSDDKPAIPYDLARRAVIPFGKYKGQTLDMISTHVDGSPDLEGLKYLDWLVGEYKWFKEHCSDLYDHVVAFLEDSAVKADLEEALA